MKCMCCGKEIELNENGYSFHGGLGNKKIGDCCSECSKLLRTNLLMLQKSVNKYNDGQISHNELVEEIFTT